MARYAVARLAGDRAFWLPLWPEVSWHAMVLYHASVVYQNSIGRLRVQQRR
jgi:hypothetical protein